MSLRISKIALLLLLLGALYFFLKPRVSYLDFYEGKVVDTPQQTITATLDGKCAPVTEYFIVVEQPGGELKKAQVDYLDFAGIKRGMKVKKRPLSSKVRIIY